MGPAAPMDFLAEHNRMCEEWHEACVDCGKRYQGYGTRCAPCAQTKREREEAAKHRLEIMNRTRTARLMLPPWDDWATFEKLKSHPAIDHTLYDVAEGWTRNVGNLVLLGPTGIGKTALVHATAHRFLKRAVNDRTIDDEDLGFACGLRWYNASSLALARKQSRLGSGEADAVEDAMNATVLILDEVGYESICDCTLFDVIDARYREGEPTIVTSGRREAELAARYGDSFMRRLRELGRVVDLHTQRQEGIGDQ